MQENIIYEDDGWEYDLEQDDYETIKDNRYVENPNVDAFWAKGWYYAESEFFRSDNDRYDNRWWRAFQTRYRLDEFALSKSLRRVLNKNADLNFVIRPIRITPSKEKLYSKHYSRYNEKQYDTLGQSYRLYRHHPFKYMELCVFKNRRLVACSFFEVAKYSVKSSSAMWDVDFPKRSLGILTVLLEMQYAIRKKKKYYYLGHYLKQDPNYQYKLRFPGLEFYDWDNDRWVDRRDADKLLDQKLKRKEVLPPFKLDDLAWYLTLPAENRYPEIAAIALFGSHARGTARPDSDIDILILTADIERFFTDDDYISNIGRFRYARRENWCGLLETIRAFYRQENGNLEFNLALPSWADLPVNNDARRIAKDGMKILYDPQGILEKLQTAVISEIVK